MISCIHGVFVCFSVDAHTYLCRCLMSKYQTNYQNKSPVIICVCGSVTKVNVEAEQALVRYDLTCACSAQVSERKHRFEL